MATKTYNLFSELLPKIEEAYKASVCGYQPIAFDKNRPPVAAKDRWKEAVEIWLPVSCALLEECVDDMPTVCRKLTDVRSIESVRLLTQKDDIPARIRATIGFQDVVLLHIICVPFKDLVIG